MRVYQSVNSASSLGTVSRLCLIVLGVAHFASTGSAAVATFNFNANQLIKSSGSAGLNKAAGNQKIIAQDVYNINSSTSGATWTSSNSFNTYERWANGLNSGEGIASFNIFLYSSYANAASWGQQLKLQTSNSASVFQATAGAGWSYKIVSMNQSNAGLTPGVGEFGYSVQWYTTDNSKRINANTNMDGFSFTAPVELFDSTTNATWDVTNGMNTVVWVGTQNRPGDQLFTSPDNYIEPLKFDYLWNGSGVNTFAAEANSVWNGSMVLTAVIPEPTTGSLLLISLLAGAALRRRQPSARS